MSSCGTRTPLHKRERTERHTSSRYAARMKIMPNRDFSSGTQRATIRRYSKRRLAMRRRLTKLDAKFLSVLLLAGPTTVVSPILTPVQAAVTVATAPADGVIKQRSDDAFDETLGRLKADIATKKLRFF